MRIGIGELIVILIIAVGCLSPEKLPEYTKYLAELFRKARSAIAIAKETTQPIQDAIKPAMELKEDIDSKVDEIKSEITQVGKEN